jgi:hypothetical protein
MLANEMERHGELDDIELFISLNLMGKKNPKIVYSNPATKYDFEHLMGVEERLSNWNFLENHSKPYITKGNKKNLRFKLKFLQEMTELGIFQNFTLIINHLKPKKFLQFKSQTLSE